MSVLLDLRHFLMREQFPDVVMLGRVPDQPDTLVALREYPAEPSVDVGANGLPALERRAVQLLARCGKDEGEYVAERLAWRAYRILVGRHVTVEREFGYPERYDWVRANATPALLGYDANDRPLYVVNFSVQRWGDVSDHRYAADNE